MSDAWLGFLGGILATLVGALIASMVQRRHETARRKSEAQLDIYFRLLELHNQYFWVAAAELHGEKPREETLTACREISWKLADRLRTFDEVAHLEEILTLLFSSSIQSANERANRFGKLIDAYGTLVNPSYSQAIKRISEENLLKHVDLTPVKSNAPGAWRSIE